MILLIMGQTVNVFLPPPAEGCPAAGTNWTSTLLYNFPKFIFLFSLVFLIISFALKSNRFVKIFALLLVIISVSASLVITYLFYNRIPQGIEWLWITVPSGWCV